MHQTESYWIILWMEIWITSWWFIYPTIHRRSTIQNWWFFSDFAGPSHMKSRGPGGASPGSAKKKHGQHVKTGWWFGTFGLFFHIFHYFSIYWECHDPNWFIFFRRGRWLKVAQPPTSNPCVSWAYSRVYQVVAIQCFYGSRIGILTPDCVQMSNFWSCR